MLKKRLMSPGRAFGALLLCLILLLGTWPDCRAAFAADMAAPAEQGAAPQSGKAPDKAPDKVPDKAPGKSLSAAELARLIDPSALNLGPDARRLYYYLVLSSAMAENEQVVIALALKGLLELDPSLAVFQDSATILLARQEWDAAETMAKDGLEHFPGNEVLTLLLAGAYSESGRLPQAVRLLETFLKKNPGHVECVEELVKLYLKDGQKQKAAEVLAGLPDAGDKPDSEIFRAGVLSSVGRLAEAREILQRLLDKNPALIEAWLELAYVASEQNRPDEAIEAYLKAAELMPDHRDLWFRIAMLHLEADRPAEAMQALTKAAPVPEMYLHSATRFAQRKQWAMAEELLARAREAGADQDECALLLSMIRQESAAGLTESLAPLEEVAKSSPLYAAALEQKARAYLIYKDYDRALSVASGAREAFPERRELWGIEAYALLRQEKSDQAESLLVKALERHPDDEELLYSLGSIQHEAGKDEEAMKTMERLIDLNPRNYRALNYVGYVLAEQNRDLQRAYTLIAAALEQQPEAGFIVDSMAWVQFRLGRHEEAWQSINRCLDLGGDEEATIWEHYGDIALALDKKDEAAKGYREAISRRPDNEAELRKKLDALKKK